MATRLRERFVENLAVGSALGLLALLVAALSLIVDSNSTAFERKALAGTSATDAVVVKKIQDPAFERIYSLHDSAGPSFGVVISLRSSADSALVAARFSPKGELMTLEYLGSCSSRLPPEPRDSLSSFAGADEALARASEAIRKAVQDGLGNAEAGS
jgi:hypothetical protein